MNIDEMQAGPEMDLAIRTDVMGWTERHADKIYGIASNFRPSHSIADAWEVVEALRARGLHFHHGDVACFGPPQERRAAFYDVTRDTGKNQGWNPYEATARTDALAICRAALKAVR